jgi:uncharacterized membrane protein
MDHRRQRHRRRGWGRAGIARNVREMTGSLWFLPLALSLAGAALGIALPWVDHALGPDGPAPRLYPMAPDSGARLVEVAAGALASLAAISFSMAMVTIQLAATQYTPRLLRNFMSDRTTKAIIGFVIGTVVYLIVVVPPTDQGPIQGISFAVALLLSVTSLVLLPVFFHHVTRSVQASTVVTNTAKRSHATIEQLSLRCEDGEPPPRSRPDLVVSSDRTGYLQVFDEDSILDALPPGALARVEVAVGAFVLPETPLVSVWSDAQTDADRIRDAFAFSRERSHPQDILFGVRQLVDIAVRALSPAMNDPTTAIMAMNEVGSLVAGLVRAGAPARPTLRRRAERDRVFWTPALDVSTFLEGTFDDVAAAAGTHGRVVARMLEILAHLAATSERPDLRAPLVATGFRLVEVAGRDGPLPGAWPERIAGRLRDLERAARGERGAPLPAPTLQ